jgi:hypothetical protein
MAEGDFRLSKKEGSKPVASAVMEMTRLVRAAASPAVPGEKVPHAIARAAHRLGISRGRATSYWYGKARVIPEEDLERARDAAVRRAKDAELLRDDYQRALAILARLEAGLASLDADFHQPQIDAVRDIRRSASRPGDAE